ncbi:hypothetical protein NP493_44g13033 [Ridgeia piscesae]|uniref:Major facilitator superfamily (MFS) profile domain-containing protein n=1 Tax=Ridgeia piscesae TaxID=27915 RepID=A0AAD9PBX6_RIDPI|nr:hypothetical protein NP493_44g13033 [Ridgeia piscesae]
MVNFLVVGCCVRSFGVFFHIIQERFHASAAEISWIPALVGCVALLSAMPVNLICNKFGHRRVTVVGGLLMNTGFVLSTFAKELWVLYFTYGILIGAGIGLSYVPSLVIIGTYFEKRRALANGMTFAAGSVGTFVVPPVIKYLLDTYGFDGTFYILGGMVFHVSVAGMLFRPPEFYVPRYLMRQKLLRMRVQSQPDVVTDVHEGADIVAGSVMCECQPTPDIAVSVDSTSRHCCKHYTIQPVSTTTYPQKPSNEDVVVPIPASTTVYVIDTSTPDGGSDSECAAVSPEDTASNCDACSDSTQEVTYNWGVLKKPLLYIYVLTLSLSDSSVSNAFMMVPPHAVDIGVSKLDAVFLVSVMGITDGISRLLTGLLADFDKVEKKHIYKASIGLCALLFFVFPLVKCYVDLAVVCGLCGLVSGSFVVLAPVLLAEKLGSVNIPVTYGVMYSTTAFFYLGSPVFMGLLRDRSGHWDISFYVTGALVTLAAVINLLEPLASKPGHKHKQQE